MRVCLIVLVAIVVAGCSKPEPKPESNGSAEADLTKPDDAKKPTPPPTDGEYACAESPTAIGDVKVEPPYGEVHPEAPPLRIVLPEALEGLEPPKNAGQPVEAVWCEKPQAADATEALLTDGRGFTKCCMDEPQGADFVVGCMMARGCKLELPNTSGKRTISTKAELAEAVAPVGSVASAIGVVALHDRRVWVPYGPQKDETLAETNRWFDWFPTQKEPVEVEAEEHPWGYVVRVPAYETCGCSHHLFRLAYRVAKDGSVCRLAEKPELVGYAQKNICID